MSTGRRILASLAVIGVAAVIVGGATFAAFSGTANNPGNTFQTGTVAIEDNDSGAAMFTVTSLSPNDTKSRCIKVTYTGTLGAGVRLYGSASGALAPYLGLVVTRGDDASPSFPSCTGFTADATDYTGDGPGVVYSGPLSSYPASWAAGIADPVGAWAGGEAHSYRFEVTLADDPAGQGQSATAEFDWEARSQ